MLKSIILGIRPLFRLRSILLLLFVWQGMWSLAYFQYAKPIAGSILRRIPDAQTMPMASSIFSMEGQVRLFQTDMAYSTLWVLLGLFLLRWMFDPFIDAGIYYTLNQGCQSPSRQFWTGVRSAGRPFFTLFIAKIALLALPLYWYGAKLASLWENAYRTEQFIDGLAPSIYFLVIYLFILHVLFKTIQYITIRNHDDSLWKNGIAGFTFFLRYLIPILSLFLIIYFGLIAFTGLTEFAAFHATGLLTIVFHQLLQIFSIFSKAWTITSLNQYMENKGI